MFASRVPCPHVVGEDTEQVGGFLGEFRLELAWIQTFRVFKQRLKDLERRESRIIYCLVGREIRVGELLRAFDGIGEVGMDLKEIEVGHLQKRGITQGFTI